MEQNTSQSTDPITPYAPSGVVQDYSNSPYGHDGQLRHSGFAKTSFWVSLISLGLMAVGLIVTMVIIFSAFPAVSSGSRNKKTLPTIGVVMSGLVIGLFLLGIVINVFTRA